MWGAVGVVKPYYVSSRNHGLCRLFFSKTVSLCPPWNEYLAEADEQEMSFPGNPSYTPITSVLRKGSPMCQGAKVRGSRVPTADWSLNGFNPHELTMHFPPHLNETKDLWL